MNTTNLDAIVFSLKLKFLTIFLKIFLRDFVREFFWRFSSN